jgi:hypothetical protein
LLQHYDDKNKKRPACQRVFRLKDVLSVGTMAELTEDFTPTQKSAAAPITIGVQHISIAAVESLNAWKSKI